MEAEKSCDLQSEAGEPKYKSNVKRRPKSWPENRLSEKILPCSGCFVLFRAPVNCTSPAHNGEGNLLQSVYQISSGNTLTDTPKKCLTKYLGTR